ncbi:MAG: HD domain-containing protein, partial [Gammaproteobacteria bacterium]|nr:HD domain-containing protein [Gammaproteobacteria bacterium]
MSKEEAFQLLSEHVSSKKKKRHMIAVSAIMKRLSKRLGMNEEEWELVGLLHDLDYDIIEGDMRGHGLVASKILEGKLPEECLHAI